MENHERSGQQASELPPLPPSTINQTPLSHSMKHLQLSTASATALPPSPAQSTPHRKVGQRNFSSSPSTTSTHLQTSTRSPIQRSPSSLSVENRSSTPSLLKKSSMGSLRGGTSPRPSGSRRGSAQYANGALGTTPGKSPLSSLEEPPSALTAASVASTHFESELKLHGAQDRPTDTIVVLHDAVYGHRYSRPRTSKAALSTIVERPERIHASIVGLSAAYVRLGERHADGRYPIHPKKDASSLPNIPFRIHKTERTLPLTSQAVTNVHGTKWMEELKIMCTTAEAKLAMNGKELTRPELNRGPEGEPAKFHEGDLYLCAESLNAMEGALGAVCDGVDAVFNGTASGKGPSRAFVVIRPPGHHCSASYPSGFCWLNNVHVGIAHASLAHGLTHAAMIDFDLHHGDGSQAIAWEHNARASTLPKNAAAWKKTSIGYFSLHDINSYPCEMGDPEKVKNASLCIENAHGQNIWNVHLQSWKSDNEFWELYDSKYAVLLEKTRSFLRTQTQRIRAIPNGPVPKAAIFLSAGFDASEWESSGMQRHKVNVPTDFYARLTRDVVRLSVEEGCAVDGRVISVLEGGYSDRALSSGVMSHMSGLAGGEPIPIERRGSHRGLGYEMARKFGSTEDDIEMGDAFLKKPIREYDPTWWALPQLETLDAVMNPSPTVKVERPRDVTPPTYFSPTQSFTAKIVIPPRRSVSSLSHSTSQGSFEPVIRAPSPPPPDVDWATAAHELSKLLIPTDRETKSCRAEDLNAEATRKRQDRQSLAMPPAQITDVTPGDAPTAAPTRMALRMRKKPVVGSDDSEAAIKPISKTNRRKTVAGTAMLASETSLERTTNVKPEPAYSKPTQTSARRLSLASNAGSVASQATQVPSTTGAPSHTRVPSGPVPVSQRPGSSQSIRPGSSMSSHVPIKPSAAVVVKKTRAPAANPRPRAPKRSTSAAQNKPAPSAVATSAETVPRVPSMYTNQQNASTIHEGDMDSLTSGMNKIKINLTTKAQREAREKSVNSTTVKPARSSVGKAAPRTVATKAASKEPTLLSTKEAVAMTQVPNRTSASPPEAQSPTVLFLPPSTPPKQKVTQLAAQEATHVPLPVSLPVTPLKHETQATPTFAPFASAAPATENLENLRNILPPAPTPPMHKFKNANGTPDVFIPYQPEGPTPRVGDVKQEELKWLPPNTGTPSPMKMERKDLPVFSATGAIPFSTGAVRSGHHGSSGADLGSGIGKEGEKLSGRRNQFFEGKSAGKEEPAEPEAGSIWDVPPTPQKQ